MIAPTKLSMARKSILVVDDEKNQREILETILSGEGYDVTTAVSGEAALKFVETRRFDLVSDRPPNDGHERARPSQRTDQF